MFGFWWSLGCAPSRRLGTFMDFSQSFHSLRCLRFALHQKDISGSSLSPEVAPRCILRRKPAVWRWWSCSSRRRPRWLWKTAMAGGLDWEMWWAFDVFCFLILSYYITTYYFTYYFVAAVLFVERWDFLWSVVSQGILGSSGTGVV